MGKKELKQELEKQIRSRNWSNIFWAVEIAVSILLIISVVFAIIGLPALIIGLIFGYGNERKRNDLLLELKKL